MAPIYPQICACFCRMGGLIIWLLLQSETKYHKEECREKSWSHIFQRYGEKGLNKDINVRGYPQICGFGYQHRLLVKNNSVITEVNITSNKTPLGAIGKWLASYAVSHNGKRSETDRKVYLQTCADFFIVCG